MSQKRIGFLSNKLTPRGTEIAMYDYADFNETLLKNKSIIISRDYNCVSHEFDVSLDAYKKFHARFTVEYYASQHDIDAIVEKHGLTHLYIIKGGNFDGLISTKCKNLIHCVFVTTHPHGEVYSVVSEDVNRLFGTKYPAVPHMIRNHDTKENLRESLSIPNNAIVFGRYGGVETFDIRFVHDAIRTVLNERNDVYFLFMNTNQFHHHPRIIYLPATTDMEYKKKFINTCDALLHARGPGETFGLTCGEFAIELKPVITYSGSRERNHLNILGDKAVLYHDYDSVHNILLNWKNGVYDMESNGYFEYTPEKIMKIFDSVYLQDPKPTPTPIYKIYVNGFWGGFSEKTDANHIGFFESLFKLTPLCDFEFTSDRNQANILFESVFFPSLANAKNWLYKIQYSGEPRLNLLSDYNLTLFSDHDNKQVLDLPLFVYYIHGNNFLDQLIHRPIRTTVPSKFCCFIVSNGGCKTRNKMFEMLNKYKKVDSYGNFANNMGTRLRHEYWSQEFRDFLSEYKFIICFENSKFGTYSTEKIVNPYLANIIPIYWSSHHIKNVFNPESMLFLEDEREETFTNLVNRVIELDNDDAKYLEYVNRPVFNQLDYWNANYTMDVLSLKLSAKLQQKLYKLKYFVTHYTPLIKRKQHILQKLKDADIYEYEIIETKDREVLTQEELNKFTKIKESEISLFLKHVEIFKMDTGNDIIVVFEDDAILCDNFKTKLDACLSELQGESWDILFSGECCGLHCDIEPGRLVKKTGMSRGCCMYVLNAGVGKRLYEIFQNQSTITYTIDWWLYKIQPNHNLNYFWSEPTLVSQGSDTGLFQGSISNRTNFVY
jgi:hypothetical protein